MKKNRKWIVIVLLIGIFASSFFWWEFAQESAREIICRAKYNQDLPLVPDGALWQNGSTFRHGAPEGFQAATGWITTSTVFPCIDDNTIAQLHIDYFEVREYSGADDESIIVIREDFDDEFSALDGGLFDRRPIWFATDDNRELSDVVSVSDGEMVINLAHVSQDIGHFWTERFDVVEGNRYSIVVRLAVEGAARVHFGMDYWRDFEVENNGFDPFCRGTHNCEAWVSDWIGDTNGEFITITMPINREDVDVVE